MWSFNYTLPTFLILMILLVYYVIRPRLSTRLNRSFVSLLVAELATMLADYLATSMDQNYAAYSISALYFVNAVFFCCYIARSFLFYWFTVNALNLRIRQIPINAGMAILVLILAECTAIINPVKEVLFSIDGNGYHSGPLYHIVALQSLFFILASLSLLVMRRYARSQSAVYAVLVYNGLLLIGVVVRYMLPQVLIMNMFCLLAILVLFVAFQNPDYYINKTTGLFNRQAFRTVADEIVDTKRARTLIGFIIKNFSANTELYGRQQMNAGLASIAAYLRAEFPECHAYYLGNGQFIVGMDQSMDQDAALLKLEHRFQQPWDGKNADLYLRAGFLKEEDRRVFDSTDEYMDCLYSSFQLCDQIGRTDYLIIDALRKEERASVLRIRRALERALQTDRLEVYMQPIVDASDHHLIGAEALARIQDPELGLLMPGQFIPLAEENGSILRLGEQIFRKTCAFLAEHGQALGLEWVNVNLSPIQCMNDSLPEQFHSIVKEYGLRPDRLHLEITEQANVDPLLLQQQMQKMADRGFLFVLDDYGTGYSNVDRIKYLPFYSIKMDLQLVWDYFREPDKLLPLSIEMVRDMGFSVTAEGVESLEMARELDRLGCSHLQGFYFSKPIPLDQFTEKYRK